MSKIYAVVDTDCLPARLALTPGETTIIGRVQFCSTLKRCCSCDGFVGIGRLDVTAAFSITSASPFVTGTHLDNYDHGLERAISNSILCSGSACAIWKAMWSGILQLPA
jgi:hypothetical protein